MGALEDDHAEENQILADEDAKVLLALCHAGRLYDVERWIAARRSLKIPAKTKKGPLEVAVEKGFHSLVELLVRNEPEIVRKNKALAQAITKKRLDLVEVLLKHGADINSVPLTDVFLTWEPAMIRFFLDGGADAIAGAPFAVAFADKIRTTLRPFVEYRRSHPELAGPLNAQADQALRYFASKGDLKWVSLMLWAGANPRTRGPGLFEGHADDPDWHTTAMDEACCHGHLQILSKFKPDAKTDRLGDLLSSALFSRGDDVTGYLLKIGANANNKENGGSVAVDRCLTHFRFENFEPFRHKTQIQKHALHQTLDTLRALVAHGARWRPDDSQEMNWVRKSLYECEPAVTVEVVKILAHKAATPEILEELLAPPRMRQHLSALGINTFTGTSQKSRAALRTSA